MGFISSIKSEQQVSITFYSSNVTVTNGIVQDEAWTEVTTVKGLFWTDGQNISLISEKLKTTVDGTISIDYKSSIANLDDDSRFKVNGNYYRIVHIDNPGMQNEVLQIAYKREKSN